MTETHRNNDGHRHRGSKAEWDRERYPLHAKFTGQPSKIIAQTRAGNLHHQRKVRLPLAPPVHVGGGADGDVLLALLGQVDYRAVLCLNGHE